MVHIPQDLLVNIISHVGKYGFRYLGPLIASTKETKNAVFSPLVLQSVDLSEFKTESSMVQVESIYRPFFSACVEAGNVDANLFEGLRILCQEGPTESGFAMVAISHPHSISATFITGVFRICAGQYESGIETISHIWNLVPRWEDVVVVADMVMEQIVRMGPAGAGIYFNSFHYPVDDIPHCTYIHCAADNICEDCFGFWYSLIIRSIC